jgi:ubiquinone/menaquinone biosynthesis C-methylase UbiE
MIKESVKNFLENLGFKKEYQGKLKEKVLNALDKIGLANWIYVIFEVRRNLSYRYIRGNGLEIGALHYPQKVPRSVEVKYVDRISREEAIKKYPELDESMIIDPTYIDDGFILEKVPDASQDFLIANHVLEHSNNPILALSNWSRVLKPGGIMLMSIPKINKCFDRGRELTSLEHFIDDYKLVKNEMLDDFSQKNRAHYSEWTNISIPNITVDNGEEYLKPCDSKIEKQIDDLQKNGEGIHFHTFSKETFRELLFYFTSDIQKDMKLLKCNEDENEVVSILRKE